MQPGNRNDANQHWIPQFLLKGFGLRNKASSVYELDKQTNAVTARKVSEVASKPHLLTEQDDGELRKIEDAAAKAMSMARKKKGTDIEDMPSGEVMDGFGALHDLIKAMEPVNPYIGVNAQGSRTAVVDAFVATVKETMEQNGEIIDEQDFRKYVDEQFNHEVLFLDNSFRRFRWEPHIHIAPDGEYFVIGDSPVISIRSAHGEPLQQILPISSKRVVTFTYNENLIHARARVLGETGTLTMLPISSTLSSDEVRSLNAHYFHRTRIQCIYGRNESILKQSACQPSEWAIGENVIAEYERDLTLKLIRTLMTKTYKNIDLREIIGDLPVSYFVRRAKWIRRKLFQE